MQKLKKFNVYILRKVVKRQTDQQTLQAVEDFSCRDFVFFYMFLFKNRPSPLQEKKDIENHHTNSITDSHIS